MDFQEFLKKRGVPSCQIDKLLEDKIDIEAIKLMTDEEISIYLPAKGDRLALRALYSKQPEEKKNKLFNTLRQKMKLRSRKYDNGDSDEETEANEIPKLQNPLKGNKNASKTSRKLELGWIHDGHQIRKRNGGGTRNVVVPKTATKTDILDRCKELFFPNGKSKHHDLKNLTCEVLDFKETPFPDNITVGEIYDEVKMGIVRFYLSTKLKENTESDDSDNLPDPELSSAAYFEDENQSFNKNLTTVEEHKTSASATGYDFLHVDNDIYGEDQSTLMPHMTSVPLVIASQSLPSNMTSCQNETGSAFIQQVSSASVDAASQSSQSSMTSCQNQIQSAFIPQMSSVPIVDASCSASSIIMAPGDLHMDYSLPVGIPGILIPTYDSHSSVCSTQLSPLRSSENVDEHANGQSTVDNLSVPDDIDRNPRSPTPPPENLLTVHRVNILEEMIGHFKNKNIITCRVMFKFVGEAGSDQKGVSREAYTAFWSEFLTGEAEGEETRVPAINTKWQEEEWNSIGRILLKGFTDHAVFPLQMNMAFVVALIYGEDHVAPEMLIESFLSYICHSDRDIVKQVLAGELNEDMKEDFVDFLDRYGCRNIPSLKEEMRLQIIQIAHKQLIQKPKYALDKMKDVSQTHLKKLFPTITNITEMFQMKKPTTKRVLNLLIASPSSSDESRALGYLQQFIRAQNDETLKKLLRFFTGADTMCVGNIEVSFTSLIGFGRRIIAHTCGPVIELPSTYQSYPEFRKELECQLSSEESFKMDIA